MTDDSTSAVRSMYEAYPYPERMPGGASDPYLDLVRAYAADPVQGRASFLDAGCGTGVNVLGGATLYSHFDVFACDINRVALAELQNELLESDLTNAQVREADLTALPEDFGPERGFDIIFCTGVLHHMAHPETALRRLVARLAPQGVLRLMVYSERGRADLCRFAQAAQRLWPAETYSWPERLRSARELMSELQRQGDNNGVTVPPLRGTWSDATGVGAAEFADRYLHPLDHPYTTANFRALLEGAGLQFLDWFEPRDWDLDLLLPDFAASPDCPRDFWGRVELVDGLFERPKLDMYVVKNGFQRRTVEVGQSTLLATNPQLFFEQVTVRGAPLAQAARLRMGGIEPLTRSQGRLIHALGRRYASLRQLCSEWDESPTGALLDEAQSLVDRGFLFSPHPVEMT